MNIFIRLASITLGVAYLLFGLGRGPFPVSSAHAASDSCQLTWTSISVPQASARDELNDVYALNANDVWAVGTADGATLTEHWDGAAWNIVPSPNAPTGANVLFGVYGSASDNVWAVGSNQISDTETRALLLHWNGSAWNMLPEPLPNVNHWLADVSGSSANDVWAVGTYFENADIKNLVLHWDGSAWSQKPIPAPPTQSLYTLNALAIIAPNDIWAAGAGLYHWDGAAWQLKKNSNARAVTAFAANDVWFTGAGINGFLHWNGARWQTFAPDNSMYVGEFVALDGAAANNIYAVGSAVAHGSLGVSQHFNGTRWREVAIPASNRDTNLNGISVVSATDVWVVGSFDSFLPPSAARSLVLRGTLPCANPPSRTPTLLSPPNRGVIKIARPTLDWRDMKQATSYRVQIRAVFGTWQNTANVTESQYKTPKLARGMTYRWRVRACNVNGCGKWSEYFTFTLN